MKRKRQYIQRVLTIAMLGVFSLAIIPWSILHHHEQVANTAPEQHCTHKLHLKTQRDTCLICAVHFEKNYTITDSSFVVYLTSKLMAKNNPIVTSSYTRLITASLRGPPTFSLHFSI
ncbi:MAG: hypothetical protein V4541_06760 [Bacteroidota bacterium]